MTTEGNVTNDAQAKCKHDVGGKNVLYVYSFRFGLIEILYNYINN